MPPSLRPVAVFALASALALACGACGPASEAEASPTITPVDTLAERDALESAPESVEIEGTSIAVTSAVFLPSEHGASSRGLRVSATLRTRRGEGLPAGLALTQVYVVRGADVWVAPVGAGARPSSLRGVLEGGAQNGPTWRVGERVDVVVRVQMANDGSAFLARRAVAIAAAD